MPSSAGGPLNSDTAATGEAAAFVVAPTPTTTANGVDPNPTTHTNETPEGPDSYPLKDTSPSDTSPTAIDQTPMAVASPLSGPEAIVEVLLKFGFTWGPRRPADGQFKSNCLFIDPLPLLFKEGCKAISF